jgi:hypothetical protein
VTSHHSLDSTVRGFQCGGLLFVNHILWWIKLSDTESREAPRLEGYAAQRLPRHDNKLQAFGSSDAPTDLTGSQRTSP